MHTVAMKEGGNRIEYRCDAEGLLIRVVSTEVMVELVLKLRPCSVHGSNEGRWKQLQD